jgi:hypothetical protein
MRKLPVLVGAAVAVVGLLVGANPASASVSTVTSALGAGYLSAPADTVKTATVTFKVPNITCAHNDDYEPLFLGVFGLDNSNVLTEAAFMNAACNNGSKVYFGEVGDSVTNKLMSITIGDIVLVRLTETGSLTTAFIRDVTQKTTQSITKAKANDAKVLVGDLGSTHVPTFGPTLHMSLAKVNGVVIGDAPVTNRQRLKSNTDIQIGATLVASGQAGFSLLFKHND